MTLLYYNIPCYTLMGPFNELFWSLNIFITIAKIQNKGHEKFLTQRKKHIRGILLHLIAISVKYII